MISTQRLALPCRNIPVRARTGANSPGDPRIDGQMLAEPLGGSQSSLVDGRLIKARTELTPQTRDGLLLLWNINSAYVDESGAYLHLSSQNIPQSDVITIRSINGL